VREALAASLAALRIACAPHPAAAGDPAAALPAAPAPLERSGAIERHTPETLWERIDGEAELYKAYGLASSAHALYADPRDPDRRVTVSAYETGSPLSAFGLFAALRPASCAPAGIVSEICLDGSGHQGLLWRGSLLVVADAAGGEDERTGDLRRAMEAVAAALGPAPPPPAPLRDFARVAPPETIGYQPQHLLGREALPPGLTAALGGRTVFFAPEPADPAGQGRVLSAYGAILEGAQRSVSGGRQVLAGRDPRLGPVTLVAGGGGIAGACTPPGTPALDAALAALVAP
jgi:hypothetical protein